MEKRLYDLAASVRPPDEAAKNEARRLQARLAKPPGSLGRLEELSIRLAGITGRVHNEIKAPHLLVFAADNGVAVRGVSSAPQSVTLKQAVNIARGKTGAAVMAAAFGCAVTVCDVGIAGDVCDAAVMNKKIAYGTRDIVSGPAMTREQAVCAVLIGAELASGARADAVGIGEMGIGNTTTASAVLSVILGADPEYTASRGGGLTREAFAVKKAMIRAAIDKNRPNKDDVLDVLSKVGGFDIAAMCGAFIGAAYAHRPAVVDGFISAVAALCAVRLCPNVSGYLIPSHASAEAGHKLAMEALGLKTVFDLNMRLGEGSGCPLMFETLRAACAVINNMATFEEAGIDDSYLDEIRREGGF
ncbi:MAG: nicotinate-nucleotide--dimethylbenzimidazole phosphoribosyltransferase [Clostridia bacterium]|nr:nicotinate-nucleotide--dimethylbenzimidazole phosphoribosyltransferase [Clostridia bacterium]